MSPKEVQNIIDPVEQLRQKKRVIRHYIREDGMYVTEIDGVVVGKSICLGSRDPERRRQAWDRIAELRKEIAWENFFDKLAERQGKDPSVYDAARGRSAS